MSKAGSTTPGMEVLTREVARGGGTAFMGGVFGSATALALHILLGRILGPASYGLYSLGRSVVGILQFVSSLGLNQGVVRFCAMYRGAKDQARVKGTLISALWVSGISGTSLAIVIFIFSDVIARHFFHDPRLILVLRIFACSLPFGALTDISAAFAQSFQRIDYQQIILNVFRPLVNLGLVVAALILSFHLVGAISGFIGSWVLAAALGAYFMVKIFPLNVLKIKAYYNFKPLLRFSIPTFLTGLSYLLLTYTDRIMLGYFGKASDVGIYNAATTVALQLPIFLTAFISIFMPLVSDLYHKRNLEELNALFKTTTRWIFLLSIPIFLIVMAFPRFIMLAFGSSYISGAVILEILAVAQLINISTGPVGMVLKMTGRQDLDLLNGVVLVVLNIVLNLWLIPIYGVRGAAFATCFSIAMMHILRLIEVFRFLKLFPYDMRYLKPIAAGLMSALMLILSGTLFKSSQWYVLFTQVVLLLFVYGAVLLIAGLDGEDRMVVEMLKKKLGKYKSKEPEL